VLPIPRLPGPDVISFGFGNSIGLVPNVVIKNVSITGIAKDAGSIIIIKGLSPQKNVSGVVFDNVTRYGEPITSSSAGVQIGSYADNIQFIKAP